MEQYDRAKLRKRIQNETDTLRIATINVQGLASTATKLPQLIALLETWNIDICMVQEARVPPHQFLSWKGLFKKNGYHAAINSQNSDETGRVTSDILTLSRHRFNQIAAEGREGEDASLMTTHHLPRIGPILMTNIHGPPSDPEITKVIVHNSLAYAHEIGRPSCIIGDFNLTPSEGVVTEAIANGWLELPESPEEQLRPTRPEGKRHIDYGLFDRTLKISERGQTAGVADHDLVYYDMLVYPPDTCYVAKAPREFRPMEDIQFTEWDELWEKYTDFFEKALDEQNTELAWKLLSDATQELTCDKEHGGMPRGDMPRIIRQQAVHKASDLAKGAPPTASAPTTAYCCSSPQAST